MTDGGDHLVPLTEFIFIQVCDFTFLAGSLVAFVKVTGLLISTDFALDNALKKWNVIGRVFIPVCVAVAVKCST